MKNNSETKLVHVSPELHKKLKLESIEQDVTLKTLVEVKLNIPLKSKIKKHATKRRNTTVEQTRDEQSGTEGDNK